MSTPPAARITVRPMLRDDVAFGLRLRTEAGWNQVEEDWTTFLDLRPEGCFVAEIDGGPAGTAVTIDYGGFTWIGLVLVDPALRRRGVGTRLLETALGSIDAGSIAGLDATPAGKVVYDRFGFVEECRITRWVRDEPAATGNDTGHRDVVRPLIDTDLAAVLALDSAVFGADRSEILQRWRKRAPALAFVLERDRRIAGFCLGRDGSRRTHLGPLVAVDRAIAEALLIAALEAHGPAPLLLDAPDRDPLWNLCLQQLGFRQSRPLIRMRRGTTGLTEDPSRQWCIAGPEFG